MALGSGGARSCGSHALWGERQKHAPRIQAHIYEVVAVAYPHYAPPLESSARADPNRIP